MSYFRQSRRRWFWRGMGLGISLAAIGQVTTRRGRRQAPRPASGERLVVLFGDSITEGIASHNYVELLSERSSTTGYRFLNAGIGGDTAWNLLRRVNAVIARQPDVVVLQIGTNDVMAHLRGGDPGQINRWLKRLPGPVTLEGFVGDLRALVARLRHDTNARVAICSIPVLGEDLASSANQRVRRFNAEIAALTAELSIGYLPIYERMETYLQAQGSTAGPDYQREGLHGSMLRALWEHHIRGQEWDQISERNGLLLTTETVHLNRRSATIIAQEIEQWLLAGEPGRPEAAMPRFTNPATSPASTAARQSAT
jgi:acyl-CoA thioesterase I